MKKFYSYFEKYNYYNGRYNRPNIITNYHINLYAEGVLTSCRYSNLYEFSSDMKYITVEREIKSFSEFDIPYEYYVGMRCGEQSDISVADMNKYISRLVNSAKSK